MAITANTIPAKTGELVRALITVGTDSSGKWYSRRGSENIGSVSGSLEVATNLTLDRIWSPASNEDDDFRLNSDGTLSFAEWVWGASNVGLTQTGRVLSGDAVTAPYGPGHGKAVYLAFGDSDNPTIYELPFTTFRNTGAGWYNLTVTSAQDTVLDAIASGALVNFVVADKSPVNRDVSFSATAGSPTSTIAADAQAVTTRDASVSFSAGNPTATIAAEAQTPVFTGRASYKFEVDWDNDGNFSNTNSDVTSRVQNALPWSWDIGRSGSSAVADRAWAGTASFSLLNDDGLFSPNNMSGALVGKLLAGRRVKISMAETPSSSFIVVWSGRLRNIRPNPAAERLSIVELNAVGNLVTLARRPIRVARATGIRTGAAIDDVLDAADWPTGSDNRDIGVGAVEMSVWDPDSDVDAASEAYRLADTDGGWFREGKDGAMVFEDRFYRATGARLTSQALYSDDSADVGSDAILYQAIPQDDPLQDVYNRILVRVPQQTVAVSQFKLWESQESPPPTLEADESITLVASDAQGRKVVWETPTVTGNTASDGSGTNITSSLDVTTEDSITRQVITITNNHATDTAHLVTVEAYGRVVTEEDDLIVQEEDADSIAAYGVREYPHRGEYVPNIAEASSLGKFVLNLTKDLNPRLKVRFQATRNREHVKEAIERDLSDRVTVKATGRSQLGISSEPAFVERMSHYVTGGGASHVVTLTLSTGGVVGTGGDLFVFGTGVFGTEVFG